jgi:hypothetical protein
VPIDTGYIPVITPLRAGEQTGAVEKARVHNPPSAANWSKDGVRATLSP